MNEGVGLFVVGLCCIVLSSFIKDGGEPKTMLGQKGRQPKEEVDAPRVTGIDFIDYHIGIVGAVYIFFTLQPLRKTGELRGRCLVSYSH